MQWIGRAALTEATYAIESTTTLLPGWSTVATVAEAATDQSGVPAGYTRWQMTVPRPGANEFLRIRGTEL